MAKPVLERVLQPFGDIRAGEIGTAALMFSYSFLAMTAYNIIKPITRSKYIESLGASNIPYVQLAAGLLIGVLMAGYSWLMAKLPRRWSLPIVQGLIAALLVAFWFLFRSGQVWVSVAFYVMGLILGILLISQFWTLANVVYDPRQAKRLFGFVGGGASLGGVAGSSITKYAVRIGSVNLILVSALVMLICAIVVTIIMQKERVSEPSAIQEEKGVGARRAIELLQQSRHLRLIALVISFAAIGAVIVELQLNMAGEAVKGQKATDAITAFLAGVQLWMSIIGFVVQVTLTSRIHRHLGIGFALLLLPIGLGSTGIIMLLNAALWAPALARILDQSLRYTVDKTTREILYMPLPAGIKFEAKPFVDVTVDRLAKALGSLLLLVLVQPWGLHLSWQRLSYASVAMTGIWIFAALRARRGYQAAFRHSIETREMKPAEVRLAVADLSTIETLIQELASLDDRRVLYAIDMLESLDKRNLITPLLLYHESAAVRARALAIIGGIPSEHSERWLPAVRRMLADADPGVRAAAVGTLAGIQKQEVTDLVRPMLGDKDPRIALTAAIVLTRSGNQNDVALGEKVLTDLVNDSRDSAAEIRREFAIAIRNVHDPVCRRLLIPLLHDSRTRVAEEAMRSVRMLGASDFIFVPTLISLLCHRRFKSSAREQLVGYGEQVLPILDHFLRDPEEEIWVRRHIPATIARIPVQRSVDILTAALDEPDGFLRFKVITALEKLLREHPEFAFNRGPIEGLTLNEAAKYYKYCLMHRRLLDAQPRSKGSLIERALKEKLSRCVDRIYRLLGLLYPWKDIQAARRSIEQGTPRAKASALEFLDTILRGSLRNKLLPLLEEAPSDETLVKLSGLKIGAPNIETTVLGLIHDPDPIISATSILFSRQAMLTGLAGPMEDVLATREASDWCVFEAVSWVLASFRMPEARRRMLWQEPLPAVEVAERLQALPVFASVSVCELFQIASAGRQVRNEPGRWLYQEGIVPDSIQFLLDGNVLVKSATDGSCNEIQPPAALCFCEVLEGRAAQAGVHTSAAGICLVLSTEEWRTLLADNTDLVQGLFRTLCGRESSGTRRTILSGTMKHERQVSPAGDLKAIDRILILESVGIFSDVSAEEMRGLASIAVEAPLSAGTTLFNESDPPSIFALVSGEVKLEGTQDQPPLHAGPGDAIGVYETLADISLGLKATAVGNGFALRLEREEIFDLLSQRPDLLQQLFGALFRGQSAVSVRAG